MKLQFVVCAFGAALALVACGGDDKGDNGGGAGGTDSGASTGGTSGSGGSPSTGGSGGSPSSGGTGGTTSVTCGGTTCQGLTFGGQTIAGCCTTTNTCGIDFNGMCIDTSGFGDGGLGIEAGASEVIVPDPSCPGISLNFGIPINLPGCCDVSGVCGGSTEQGASFGIPTMCVTNAELAAQLGMSAPDAGPDKPCNYPSGDGGTPPQPDAGDGGMAAPDSGNAGPDASTADGG
jgi:hypothetical protein